MRQWIAAVLLTASAFWPERSHAQFEPRAALSTLIAAFQNCGPPQVYQLLGQQLFQLIAQQTNGMGCYPQLQQLGPVSSIQVVNQQQLPAGPMYALRVQHQSGNATDWFLGFSNYTNRIEFLNFQPAQAAPPNIRTGRHPSRRDRRAAVRNPRHSRRRRLQRRRPEPPITMAAGSTPRCV